MTQLNELYSFEEQSSPIPPGLHLLANLSGFTDAGHTLNQVSEHIFSELDHELVLSFSNDELLDYRSRRPVMYFERDHIASYEPAVLGIYLVHDEANQPFLYLQGYEPDFRWDAFAEAIAELVDALDVLDFTWIHSIPFPVPHTRPIGVTVSGNRKELIATVSEWKPQTQVPGNILHLIEYNLTKTDLPLAGLVMLVPHYLAETDYPQAAVMAFEQISAATGLVFPTDSLREQGAKVLVKINEQVSKNEDLAKMIDAIEAGYVDEKSLLTRPRISKPTTQLPSADEIAQELEGYLANRRKNAADEF